MQKHTLSDECVWFLDLQLEMIAEQLSAFKSDKEAVQGEIKVLSKQFFMKNERISTIDIIRGMVMVVMALDHVREFVHVSATTQEPLDLATTSPGLFATRWVTHLCAPIFVFLSGTSAFLSLQNQGATAESRRFQLKRGLWLLLLNFTLVNFGIFFDPGFEVLFAQVISAIGFGFVCLSFLMRWSPRVLGSIGLLIVFGHNLLQGVQFAEGSAASMVWASFFSVGFFPITEKMGFLTTYALVPWLGVMLCGYASGTLFARPESERKKLFLKIGFASLVLFGLLRTFNIYGDPTHWAPQKDWVFSLLSFINVNKYPPSLLFSLITLGIMFLLLRCFEGLKYRLTDTLTVFGKVPLFYYLLHWYLIHLVMIVMFLAQGFAWTDMVFGGFGFGRPKAGGGLELSAVYLVWMGVVVALYPVCKWFVRFKAANREKAWLRYL